MTVLAERFEKLAKRVKWWRKWSFLFEPRDLWIGVFVSPEKLDEMSGDYVRRIYVCPFPTLVLVHSTWKAGS